MRKFSKSIVKEFQTGFGRFVAIMAIIALGVGFLIGIMQATPDMKRTMDGHYRENVAYDADIKGVYGLTQEDVDQIAALDEVESVTPIISTDVLVSGESSERVGRIIGLDRLHAEENLNRLTLVEGKWPRRGSNEVVAVHGSKKFDSIQVGDEFTLQVDDSTYGNVYKNETIRVVGIVSSIDYYYGDAREVSSLGTGVVGAVFFAYSEDMYDMQVEGSIFSYLNNEMIMKMLGFDYTIDICYTDCYVLLRGSDEYMLFSDEYKNYILAQTASIEALGEEQSVRLNEVIAAVKEKFPAMVSGMSLTDAQWYVLDRASSNVSYVSFALNVEKVEEIASIFPVFFILVAALVALTSMTRMVEEDRMQIGTLKALGYGKGRIMSKYLIYCCLASIIGCVAGILIGFALFPSIFWEAYGSMYVLPDLSLAFSPWYALVVFVVALAGTIIVTWGACRSSLKEKPSTLMQPKAPKPGKRVWLERIGFIWRHLQFKWKATLRNIFRYKKNMFLTVISVMGCTALILTGFGLDDSVRAVSANQFGEIILYNAFVDYSGDLAESQNQNLLDFIGEKEGETYLSLYSESGQLIFGTDRSNRSNENVELYIVEDPNVFQSFISLHSNKKDPIEITDCDGLVLSENVSIVYDIAVGDIVRYRFGGKETEIAVSAICENYTDSYAYMSADAYKAVFEQENLPKHNTILVKTDVTEEESEEVTKGILSGNTTDGVADAAEVSSVEFVFTSQETFAGLESTMGLVIAVLVVSAGALAAIVLYNLTNINIDERRREIATLRVLGYRKSEVAGYIYRESAILTLIGTLLGLGLGFLLHLFIVSRVTSISMMFGRAIGGLSYLWAFLLTIVFAAIVYAFMLIKLNKIDMAESLKSNE